MDLQEYHFQHMPIGMLSHFRVDMCAILWKPKGPENSFRCHIHIVWMLVNGSDLCRHKKNTILRNKLHIKASSQFRLKMSRDLRVFTPVITNDREGFNTLPPALASSTLSDLPMNMIHWGRRH